MISLMLWSWSLFKFSDDLTYEEVPVQIVDVMDKILRHVVVKLVKVQWSNHSIREDTWELEEEMREKHLSYSKTQVCQV